MKVKKFNEHNSEHYFSKEIIEISDKFKDDFDFRYFITSLEDYCIIHGLRIAKYDDKSNIIHAYSDGRSLLQDGIYMELQLNIMKRLDNKNELESSLLDASKCFETIESALSDLKNFTIKWYLESYDHQTYIIVNIIKL